MTTEREQMTNEWLKDHFNRATTVAAMRTADDDEAITAIFRGFANRVLQTFGDREGMREALNIGFDRYTREKADLIACQAKLDEALAKLESLKTHVQKIVQWVPCMSYEESLVGEPAGDIKRAAEELDRLL